MIEDRLTRDERIRLEALNQAVARRMGIGGFARDGETPETVIAEAREFEAYIRDPERDPIDPNELPF